MKEVARWGVVICFGILCWYLPVHAWLRTAAAFVGAFYIARWTR